MRRYRNKRVLCIAVFLLGITFLSILVPLNTKAADSHDRLHFIRNEETGGDAIVIESNGQCGLIDTLNPSTDSIINPGNNYGHDNGDKVYDYVRNKVGCSRLDFLILTHSHSDHMGGVPNIKNLITDKTIVFYKTDVQPNDDWEDTVRNWNNHDYYLKAMEVINSKHAITCDVSASNTNANGKCYLQGINSTLHGGSYGIKKIYEDSNPFSDYATNIDWTYYFDFGDFRINLYNLYKISDHWENNNSIVTLVTHKNGGGKAALTADLETGRSDEDYRDVSYTKGGTTYYYKNRSNLKLEPTGNCTECKKLGLENQISDVIGKVDILRAGHHGAATSNSYYMLNNFQPSYYVATQNMAMSDGKLDDESNCAAISFLYSKYGTISHYTHQASQSDGAIKFQFNDSTDNKITLLNSDLQNARELVPNGWHRFNNLTNKDRQTVRTSNGTVLTGWKTVGDYWYYFNEDGIRQTGWVKKHDEENNKDYWYYLRKADNEVSEGPIASMVTGWGSIGDEWYYFRTTKDDPVASDKGPEGSAVTGWASIPENGKDYWYYFRKAKNDISSGPEASMLKGFHKIDEESFYFRTSKNDLSPGPKGSAIQNECVQINGEKKCFDTGAYLIDKTLNGPFYNINPTLKCEVNLSADSDRIMQGAYFFDHYAVYTTVKENAEDSTPTAITLVDINTNPCTVVDRVDTNSNSAIMGHANDITRVGDIFYVTAGSEVFAFVIDNGHIIVDKDNPISTSSIASFDYDYNNHKFIKYNARNLYSFSPIDSITSTKLAHTPKYYTNFIYTSGNKDVIAQLVTQGLAYGRVSGADNIYFSRTIGNNSAPEPNSHYVLTYDSNTGDYKYSLVFKYNQSDSATDIYNAHYESSSVVGDKMYFGLTDLNNYGRQVFLVYDGLAGIEQDYSGETHEKTKLTKPTISENTFTYSGETITPTINDCDSSKMTITGTQNAVDTGDYSLTFSLNDTDNYEWADETTDDVVLGWTINKADQDAPVVTNYSGTYDGDIHGVSITNASGKETLYSIDGEYYSDEEIVRNDAGTTNFFIKFAEDDNHNASSVSSASINITKADLEEMSVTGYNGDYDGSPHGITAEKSSYATTFYSADESNWTEEAPTRTEAGTTTVYVKYIGDDNHNDSPIYSAKIVINEVTPEISVAIPTAEYCKDNLVYTGNEQTLTKDPSTGYTFNNNRKTNAGTYNVAASLSDGYIWNDNTETDKTFACEISKANPTVTKEYLSSNMFEGQSYNFVKLTANVAGTFTLTPNDTSIFTVINGEVSASANEDVIIRINALSAGSSTLTMSFAPSNTNYNSTSDNYDVTISSKPDTAVAIPTDEYCADNLVYTGSELTLTKNPATGYSFINNTGINAGNYTITASLNTGYVWSDETKTDKSFTCSISKANLEKPIIDNYSGAYDGNDHRVTISNGTGKNIEYSRDGTTFSSEEIVRKNAGTTNLYVRFKGDTNRNDSEAVYASITILKADLVGIQVEGYSGDYDGNSHGISATISEFAEINYSSDGENWSTTAITRKNAGTTNVYVKYIGDSNHNNSDIYNVQIVINKVNPTLYHQELTNNVQVGGTYQFIKIRSSVAGTFSFTSSNTNVFTVVNPSESVDADEEKTISVNAIGEGTANLEAAFTPTDTTNYKNVSGSYELTAISHVTKVEIPTTSSSCKDNLKYTGEPIVMTKESGEGYSFLNNIQTLSGTYEITAKLKNGYIWLDDTSTDKTFTCTITKDDYYVTPTSDVISAIDATSFKVKSNTTHGDIKNYLDTNGTISSKKEDSEKAATCDELDIKYDADVFKYTLIILGDIDKEGSISLNDVSTLFSYIRKRTELSTCQIKAGTLTGSDTIHINDVAKLYQFVKGKIGGLE